jgi:hypothetical protein
MAGVQRRGFGAMTTVIFPYGLLSPQQYPDDQYLARLYGLQVRELDDALFLADPTGRIWPLPAAARLCLLQEGIKETGISILHFLRR